MRLCSKLSRELKIFDVSQPNKKLDLDILKIRTLSNDMHNAIQLYQTVTFAIVINDAKIQLHSC